MSADRGRGPGFRIGIWPGDYFLRLTLLLGKYLAYEISLFLASDEIAPLSSIQVMAISSHQIDFSFIYVSCSFRDRKKSCRRCIWQDCRINIYDGPGGVAFGPGDSLSVPRTIGWRPSAMKFYLRPLQSRYFFSAALWWRFKFLIKCKLEGCACAGILWRAEEPWLAAQEMAMCT